MITYGIIGKPLSHSFSKAYFSEKILNLGFTKQTYENFEIPNANDIIQIIRLNPHLKGLNVTYPYKEKVIDYIDNIDVVAKEIGAVNVIKILNGISTGYNTDTVGFEKSIRPLIKPHHKKALILGTGGAAKAVAFVLKNLKIEFRFVSRQEKAESALNYEDLEGQIQNHQIIINATPLGMYPEINNYPDIPFNEIGHGHLLIDLIYNPQETIFLIKGKQQGAVIKNGLEMLIAQAEEAWRIWNE